MTRDDETFIRARVHEAVAKLQPTPVPPPLTLSGVRRTLAELFQSDPTFRAGDARPIRYQGESE